MVGCYNIYVYNKYDYNEISATTRKKNEFYLLMINMISTSSSIFKLIKITKNEDTRKMLLHTI